MEKMNGGVTTPKGFWAAGAAAGIKAGRQDMALLFSKEPCRGAGVFTTNLVKAAPVLWDQQQIGASSALHAVVVNAGIANACTGEEGYQNCKDTALACQNALNIPESSVLVASTGVIGPKLPMDKIVNGVNILSKSMGNNRQDATNAAKAIMTTDTKSKETAYRLTIGGKTVVIAGMAKGSGMIHPNMATMLCFLTTDAAIKKEYLQKALSLVVEDTFNMISVDGDTSTNDSVLLLANGLAQNPEIAEDGEDFQEFLKGLRAVMTDLSKMIAGDGEGATCLFEAKVIHANAKDQAKTLAKSIITSNLTKAAIFGHDANWGRILCAMGYSGAAFNPNQVDIYFESRNGCIKIVENGVGTEYDEEEATKILTCETVTAVVDLKNGREEAVAWGCDLSFDYVKINADYRS